MDDELLTSADVLNQAGITVPGVDVISDRLLSLTCPNCGTMQSLAQANLSPNPAAGMIGLYACKACGQQVMATGHWGFRALDDANSAYRLGDYALYLSVDLFMRVGSQLVKVPVR